MSEDLEAGAAPAESGEAAPVEIATADVAPVETVESSPIEAVEPADPSLTAQEEAVEAAPVSYPSAEEFGWDDWDGNNESLPEQLRPWGQKFHGYYDQKIIEAQKEMMDSKEVYEAILQGRPDPRVKQMEASLTDWENKFNGLYGQHQYLQNEYDRFRNEIDRVLEAEAEAFAEEFATNNSDLFEKDELSGTFAELLDEGWVLEHAAVAARLPKHLREVARQAKADGVPDAYALRLAQGAKSKPAAPRPGAALTAGATTPARSSEQVTLPDTKPMSLQEYRKQVARNALSSKRR